MKKALALPLACLFAAALFACGQAPAIVTYEDETAAVTTTQTTSETTAESTAEATAEPTTETTIITTTKATTAKPATKRLAVTTAKQTTAKPTTAKPVTTTKKPATTTQKPAQSNSVPKKYVGGSRSGPLSWEEYQQARQAAQQLVGRYAGQPEEERVRGVYKELRAMFDAGMTYTMDDPHYADPYGYLVLKRASCAGSARAAGLCLDVLGIDWEHVNPGAYTHQWARVKIGGEYWICDPYGMYAGPEPAPYKHPHL